MNMKPPNIRIIFLMVMFGSAPANADNPMGYLAPVTPGVEPSIQDPRETQTLSLYSGPGGDEIGTAIVSEGYFDLCLTPISYQNKRFVSYARPDAILLSKRDYQPAADCSHYTYYDVQDGYARILSRSIDGGVWIRLDNAHAGGNGLNIVLEPRGFFYHIERLSPRDILGYYNYRLRSQPSLDAEILVTLSNTRIIHHFTGRIENGWAETIVWEMSRALVLACTSNDEYQKVATGRKWTGWIRLLDENGEPEGITFEAQTC